METDTDVQREQEALAALDRQKIDERARQERRGWMITWTSVVVIVLVTALITIALGSGDTPGSLAGRVETFRMTTKLELKTPSGPGVTLDYTMYLVGDLAQMTMTGTNPIDGRTLNAEFIIDGIDADSFLIYMRFSEVFPRPEGAPAEKEWLLLDETDSRFASVFATQSITGTRVKPYSYFESLGLDPKVKELRTENLRGIETTVNRVTVDTADYVAATGQEENAEILASQIGATMSFDVWVDGDGTLHRMLFQSDVQGAALKVTADVYPGETTTIVIPDESLVYDGRNGTASPTASPSGVSATFSCTGQQIGSEEPTSDC